MHLPLDRATTLDDRVTTPVNPSRPCYNICGNVVLVVLYVVYF